jgi:HlyD family secretion protein
MRRTGVLYTTKYTSPQRIGACVAGSAGVHIPSFYMAVDTEVVGVPRRRRWITLVAAALVVSAALILIALRGTNTGVRPADLPASTRGVACLGHIEPQDGVTVLAARSLTGQPSILSQLLVKEGDIVHAGQIVALLNSQAQLEAAWREAASRVSLAKAQLAQVEAGARPGDVLAQQARIERLEAELADAEAEHRRFASLYASRSVSQAELDTRRTRLETARQLVAEAKARLHSLTEVRPTDVDVARAAVAAAIAAEQRSRAELEPSSVRAPLNGRVLKTHAHPGEEVGPQGILELGGTDTMYVIAEVPESDVARLKVGDAATITSDALGGPMDGVVEQIGSRVTPSQILNTDPAAFVDARIVEARIRLRDPKRAERFVHAQVHVVTRP